MVFRKILLSIFFVFIIIIVNSENVHGQNLPVIAYSTPQVYTVGSVITPLSPTSTGGTVYPANYSTPVNFVSYTTPFSIAIDAANNVYTTNNSTGDLTKFNAAGTPLFTVNTGNTQASEVAADGIGNVYVSQFTTSSVLKYNAAGTLLATITGFTDPYGIAFDASNNAYIADYFTGDIFKIVAGATTASVYLTGFTKPYGITIDETGNIYVGEQGPGDIIKVAAGTLARTTFASGFNGPRHLNKDLFGNIYVADYGNNAIKRISPAGVITSVLSAGLSFPRQAAFDSSGNLFVANYGANTLLKALATSYSINASLQAGLNFNTSTGQVTGTPSTVAAATTFTITAYNTGGSSSTPLTITVGAAKTTPQPPSVITLVPSAVTTTTATLNGFANYNGSTTSVSFTYGTNPSLINGTTTIATTNSSINVANNNSSTLALTGLNPSTTYYYRVTATDSAGTTTGSILSFVTLPSSNAGLSNLAISSGTLSPVFAGGTTSYTASVSNATNTVTITAETTDPNATITVNGTTLAGGTTSAPVALNVGTNTITTVVTAPDGTTTQSYTITVTRAASSNASLSNLAVSSGTLSPAFASGTTSYSDTVSNITASVTITAATTDPNATITVNGTTLAGGTTSAPVALNVGTNTITTVVTAPDGTTTQSYTITLTRAASSNAGLSNLAISSGTLSPAFAGGTTSYTASVSNATTSIQVTPTTIDSNATITVNGATIAGGTTSAPVALNIGTNTITTVVTAPDGTTTQSYTITVTRAASSNAGLSNLAISSGTLSPAFAGGTTSYTASVSNAATSIQVTPTTIDSNATITVNGATIAGGTTSAPVALNVGTNTITTVVTAPDGTTTQSYTITVTRAASSNAGLSNLAISSGTLSPVFAGGTTSYTASVSNATNTLTITPATTDPNATITVNGTSIAGGTTSAPVALNVGTNTITTVVTAPDGTTTQSYTITVTRAASSNAGLSNLAISSGTLSPVFAGGTTSYTASVSNATNTLTITPATTDPNATITVNGTSIAGGTTSAQIALNVGTNTITTVVTAPDGTTTQSYTITVTRAASSNAGLSNLAISSGTLSPVFAGGTTSYTASVSNATNTLTITPATTDPNATITVNGTSIAGGTTSAQIALNVGTNTITTVVTAPDGTTTQSYTITVTRAASSNAGLSNLAISSGTLSPVFAGGTTSYTASVSNATNTLTITPATTDPNATITVNGTSIAGGTTSAQIALNVGTNTITTVVTAPDGTTTQSYTITLTRAASSNAGLSNLAISSGTLSPVFAGGTTSYTASVSNATTSIQVTPTTIDSNATITVNGVPVISGSASGAIALNSGPTTILTVVTAPDGITTKSYSITVNRKGSNNASLSSLKMNPASLLVQATGKSNVNYTTSVDTGTTSVTVIPTAQDPGATITVNGSPVISGSASGAIALNSGPTTILTVVTAPDGITTKSYSVTISRTGSNNAWLSSLKLNPGSTLVQSTGASNVNYTTSVDRGTTSVTVIPTAQDPGATITVNGVPVISGSASGAIALNSGPTTILTMVTAPDGITTKSYSVTISRTGSNNAWLSSLKLNPGSTLVQSTGASNVNYTTSVDTGTTSVTVIPTAQDPGATITVNGVPVISGSASGAIALNSGPTTILTMVTAPDGITTKSYSVTISRTGSNNAWLSSLKLNPGSTLVQSTGASNVNYTTSVDRGTTSVTVIPTAQDPGATITVNGVPVISGSASGAIALNSGPTTILTMVTAPDGITTKSYSVTISRTGSNNAWLSSLKLNPGSTLVQSTGASDENYTTSVDNLVTSVTVTPTAKDPNATVKVNSTTVSSGSASLAIALNVGNNTITTIVTAPDGTTTKTYTITITRAPSSNASLSGLSISSGTLSPVFAAGTTSYTDTVSNATASITITPVTTDPNATLTINGTTLASGITSAPIALNVGTNTITTVVTARDGTTTQSYTVTVIKAPSSNASLSSLSISSGTLSPVFTADITSYTGTVSNATASITITPVTTDPNATLTVNGTTLASGAASAPIVLNDGNNTITTVVTAQDGTTTQSYTVIITRSVSSNASLSNLSISSGTLSPVFAAGTTSYTDTVSNATTSIQITPTTIDSNVTVTVNGVTILSGSASAHQSLSVGPNTINIIVTAQNGATKSYSVTIIRTGSNNAWLSSLKMNPGSTLVQSTGASNVNYTTSVDTGTTSVTVIPTAQDPGATITVNGNPVISGSASGAIALNSGPTTILTVVTAPDGITTKSYSITVRRTGSSNASLSSLKLNPASKLVQTPAISGNPNYTTSVGNLVTSVTVTPTTSDPNATVTVNGTTVSSGSASPAIALNVGDNTITALVTAQDGITTKPYTIAITRAASSNAGLTNLAISSGALSPAFAGGTTSYTASVSNATTSIQVTPTTIDSNATITVNGTTLAGGTTSAPVALNIGNNAITTIVKAPDGTTTQSYTITVTRASSSNAGLSSLSISSGTLSPAFSSGTTSYTASVSNATTSIQITPTTIDSNATVTVNGATVLSGLASAIQSLSVGPNNINIIVTAQDGTTKSYSITVNRKGSNNASLSSLKMNPASLLVQATGKSNVNYTTSVDTGTTSVTVIPTAQDPGATITVNGNPVISGSASGAITLNSGPTTIITMVTAPDGTTTKSYSITVNRTGSNNASLSLLALNPASLLVQATGKSNVNYTTSVDTGTTSVTVIPTAQDPGATITVNGNPVISGSASGAITLNSGPTTILTVVTAPDGTTTKSYSITVNRTGSNNASLSSLKMNPASLLVQATGKSNVNYTTSVDTGTTSVTVIPTAQDPGATITVNGSPVISGSASGAIALNSGPTTILTVVTAPDGITTKSYSITVNRKGSNNASLSSLKMNPASLLVQATGKSNVNYTTSVDTGTTSVTVIPTAQDPGATITVNGNPVISGSASGAIALNSGPTTILTVVTAPDGITTKSYSITVRRTGSSNASLSSLKLNPASKLVQTPAISGNPNYTTSVGNLVTSVTVTPTTSDPNATVTVNGTTVSSGSASPAIALNVGDNIITALVTAQDGITTKPYTITITRAASSNAGLTNLSISSGALSPSFAAGTTSYTDTVSNAITSIQVTPSSSDTTATVKVNGATVASETTSAPIVLNDGNNTITTVVTAQDGTTTQSYTVIITRSVSSNASLSNLSISSGTLSPVFAAGTTSYTDTVSNTTASITITPVTTDPNATLTVNGTTLPSGAVSAPIALNAGTNTITTVVTAMDGTTTQSYTVRVIKAASSNASLSSLSISNGTLSPVFAASTTSYTDTVSNTTASITITPVTTDPNATLTVNGTTLASGTTSAPIALNTGNNTITNVVTAPDGTTTQSYTIVINRQQPAANLSLASLTTSTGRLTPTFDPATFNYNVMVNNAAYTIAVTPVATDVNATLTVNGTPIASGAISAPISLGVGNNTITTVVTSPDGITTQTYTLTVIRQALSSNANLVNLSLSNGSLNPAFATGTNSYSTTVTNDVTGIMVTPTTSDSTATVTVNGMPVASGSASSSQALYVGDNTITTVVTAQDGETRDTYTVMVTRAPSSNANLSSLAISSSNLNQVFAPATTSYTTSVGNAISSVTVTPIISDPNATVTVNGTILASGVTSAPINLNVGINTITTVVTAQDGTTTQSYTVVITRAPSSNANLANIALSNGSLSPAFAAWKTSYTASVSYSTTSLTITPTVSDSTATLTVNGVPLASGSASVSQPLIVGNNTITTVVTAQDGITTDTYTVTVIRATNSLDISLLLLSSHTPLTLESGSGDVNYTTTVNKSVGSITVTPTTNNSNVNLKVNGSPVTPGSASNPITLNDGPTTISMLVSSKDGTASKTYKLTVRRPALLTNANLSDLKISSGTLSPVFDPATFNYTVSVDSAISTFAITPVISDTDATLTVNNTILASGSASAPAALNEGDNTITTLVTAADGKTRQSYTITVNKQKSVVIANTGMQDAADNIVVHQAVSPNGDGINDFLLIEGIENYPGNKVSIINRNGVIIYDVHEYNNSSKAFDGHSNIDGRLQQPGTYFYIIDYTVNGEARRKTGYFILKF